MNNALTRSVTWKLNILVLFWLLLMTVAIGFFSFRHERRAMYAEMNQTVSQIARRLQHNLIQPVWEYNYEQVNLLIELEMSYPHLYAILFEDREGVLKAGKVKTQEEDVMPYDEANDLERALDASFRHSNVEIRQDDYVMGHAQIYLSDALIRRQLSELLQGLALQLFLLFGTLYLALFFSLRLVILRPIAFIDRAVRQMADKDFRVRIPALAGDELGRLADNFNRMAETIVEYGEGLEEKVRERTLELEQTNKELEQANLYQNRFFANISHEFRTPLTLILDRLMRYRRVCTASSSRAIIRFFTPFTRTAHGC